MPRLNYLGPAPTSDKEVLSRRHGVNLINDIAVNRNGVISQIEDAAESRASAEFIDLADADYATADYYQSRDALNVSVSSLGVANGVAPLVAGVVPLENLPILGSGFIKGPFGPTTVNVTGNVTTTPVKLADFAIGNQSTTFHPLAYATVAVDTEPGGQPVLEMKISNGPSSYSSQTLIARGFGRTIYRGRQMVSVVPASLSSNPAPWDVNTDIVVSMYVYSTSSTPVLVGSSSILSAGVFLMRRTS